MDLIRTEEFAGAQNALAVTARAGGHPARIAIQQLLTGTKACVCSDIVDELFLSQSTVSQHLKELKNAGLINGDVEVLVSATALTRRRGVKGKNSCAISWRVSPEKTVADVLC
ncbi:MAG TPA: metalloregulator ArsR/SmtB family transcription factor [Cyclobacteriaceae bacterium]|nr:metalloregulator ArsR/SmtB family transcription factor [Cyclobacteriaceae bacterium]